MTIHLDNGAAERAHPITMLPRFPAWMLGASLLDVIHSDVKGVVVVDSARQIVLVNHKAENIFGHPASNLLGQPLDVVVPARTTGDVWCRPEHIGFTRICAAQGELELHGVRADGTALVLKAAISRMSVRGDVFLALILLEAEPMHAPSPIDLFRASLANDARRWAVSTQQASEMEKRRFSRKLYDDIGQRLSVLKLDLDWLENRLPDTNQYLPVRLAEMQGLLDNVITLTKSMASTLRPPVLDDFGLLPAVEWMVEGFRKRTTIRCELKTEGFANKLDEAVESAVFRVIQEGLTNIERHAGAARAIISLRQSERQIELTILDDGVGMESALQDKAGCYGLITMQERVFVLGGTIRIENAEPHGLQIYACIPIELDTFPETSLHIPSRVHDTYRNSR